MAHFHLVIDLCSRWYKLFSMSPFKYDTLFLHNGYGSNEIFPLLKKVIRIMADA